jgi:hypothetical protein
MLLSFFPPHHPHLNLRIKGSLFPQVELTNTLLCTPAEICPAESNFYLVVPEVQRFVRNRHWTVYWDVIIFQRAFGYTEMGETVMLGLQLGMRLKRGRQQKEVESVRKWLIHTVQPSEELDRVPLPLESSRDWGGQGHSGWVHPSLSPSYSIRFWEIFLNPSTKNYQNIYSVVRKHLEWVGVLYSEDHHTLVYALTIGYGGLVHWHSAGKVTRTCTFMSPGLEDVDNGGGSPFHNNYCRVTKIINSFIQQHLEWILGKSKILSNLKANTVFCLFVSQMQLQSNSLCVCVCVCVCVLMNRMNYWTCWYMVLSNCTRSKCASHSVGR